jgi:hypothetical protein
MRATEAPAADNYSTWNTTACGVNVENALRVVAAREQRSATSGEVVDAFGNARFEVAHELREVPAVGAHHEVHVIAHRDEGEDVDFVAGLATVFLSACERGADEPFQCALGDVDGEKSLMRTHASVCSGDHGDDATVIETIETFAKSACAVVHPSETAAENRMEPETFFDRAGRHEPEGRWVLDA